MAPRIKRGGKRIRDATGRTRKQDCCCGTAYDCTQWNNSTIRSGISFNAEIDGLTIGTENCANCGTISLSRILAYSAGGTCSGGPSSWCHSHTLSCSSSGCFGGCCDAIFINIGCFGDTLTFTGSLQLCTCGTCTDKAWTINYTGSISAIAFESGDEITLSYSSFGSASSICLPVGYAASSMRVSFSI